MTAVPIDQPREVRAGEELDEAALAAWIGRRFPALAGRPIAVRQFPSGHSNLTYLVTAGDAEMVLRRPPFGSQVKGAHDMGRELALLAALDGRFPVPHPLALEEDAAVLGAPFYMMERVVGLIPRKTLGVPADAATYGRLSDALVDTMVALHAVDWRAAGLDALYRGEGFVRRQVEGWSRRWDDAKTEDVPAIERVRAELLRDVPADCGATIVHNDLKYDNLVLDPAGFGGASGAAGNGAVGGGATITVRAVLDWEMATVGCPLMDLGTSLGYWVEAADAAPVRMMAFVPTSEPGSLDREGVMRRYEERSGRAVARPVFYFAFGVFKLAVVGQQIYRRFVTGKTQDKRFAMFGAAVRTLGELGVRALDADRISRI